LTKAVQWEAIIFDFDGVLVDSVNVKTEAFRSLYREESDSIQQAVVDFHLEHGGLSRFEKIRFYETELLGREINDAIIDRMANKFALLVKDAVVASPPINGAVDVLNRLKGKIPMFVASGTPEVELIDIVEQRGWSGFFIELRGSPTPKTTLVSELIETHKLAKNSCLMVGDSMSDYNAAIDNDIAFLGIADSSGSHPFADSVTVHNDLTKFSLDRQSRSQ